MKKNILLWTMLAAMQAAPAATRAAGTMVPLKGFAYLDRTAVTAQPAGDDPVLLTINGVPVTRSEFEYSYNKNNSIEGAVEQKSVEEYVDMFVNYKLKVAAALEARLDTVTAFRQEFQSNRDLQLMPFLVDTAYIDSVAYSYYDRMKTQLGGKDMLHPAHILVLLPQQATDEQKKAARQKADSLYSVLKAGADFEALARQYSQDPGTARNGGLLPWIGPGSTVQEFEDAAYALQPGEYSAPVESSFGYHLILMKERKALEPFAELRDQLVSALKRQGVEEASAEARLNKLVAASGGRLTREAVLDSVLRAEVAGNADLKYLVQEYHDGLLFYEVCKQKVWDAAAADSVALAKLYKANKNKYRWTEPRFKGFVIHAATAPALKQARKIIKKHASGDWRAALRKTVNKDSTQVFVKGPYLAKQGENAYIDEAVFGKTGATPIAKFPVLGTEGKLLKQPADFRDVRSLVVNDLQEQMERQWVESLRAKYNVTVDAEVLKTVNNH